MNIVVLDDDKEIVNIVGKYLVDLGVNKNNLFLFTSVNELETNFVSKRVDILFIDINLGVINGIDYVKKNRKIFRNTKIIYITAFDDFIEDTFETEFIYFLRKPLTKDKINKAFNKAINMNKKSNKYLFISNQKGKRKICIKDIIYIESSGRIINIYLKNETISIYKKISEIESELCDSFIRCHKSFIINLDKIKSYSVVKVLLDNDVVIPISRINQKKCKKIIYEYLKGDCCE